MSFQKIFDISLNRYVIITKDGDKELYNRLEDTWYHRGEHKYFLPETSFGNIVIDDNNKDINGTDDREFLFIHIPKTGGISFRLNIIHNPRYYLKNKIVIYHFITTENNKYLDIFNTNYKLFTIIRDPVKFVISCYIYFQCSKPLKTFVDTYRNMQLKFLLGYSIFSVGNVTKKGFDKIIELVNNNRLTVGIYEGNKMKNIYRLLNINHSDNYILNKSNQTIDITDDIKTYIINANEYDVKFYDYIYNRS